MRGRVASVSSVFIGASNELGEFESGIVARILGPIGAAVFGGVGAVMVTRTLGVALPRLAPGRPPRIRVFLFIREIAVMGALEGKVVLVTGGGNGIGRDCALIAAKEGAKVVVNDLGAGLKGDDEGSAGPAEAVAAEIRAAGGEAVSNSDSVTDLKAVYGMVEQARDTFGGLHAVINPAATPA